MKIKNTPNAAFFRTRVSLAVLLSAGAGALALMGLGALSVPSAVAQGPSSKTASSKDQPSSGMISVTSYHNDISPALRDAPMIPYKGKEADREANENPKIPHNHVSGPDGALEDRKISALALLAPSIPAPISNFDGIPFPGVVCNCAPPDTNGAVGLTQYVQMVNEGYQIFNKSTGTSILGPASINSLFAGFGGVCEAGSGDPVVLYDKLADRWIITQFAGG
ncbi:MAG: hypothetical protein M3Y80_11260, partial [Verrucomicrobiota bacterium]|nr:hypothetical protein [Verrucomicrobiota bacterium]